MILKTMFLAAAAIGANISTVAEVQSQTVAQKGGVAKSKATTDDVSAKQIIDRMGTTYFKCKSYQDSGMVKTLFIENGQERTVEKLFTTVFVAPDRFRFEYTETVKPDQRSRYIIWANGKDVQTWWDLKPGIEKPESLILALSAVSGISNASSMNIPTLLFPDKMGLRRLAVTEPTRCEDGKIGDVDCFRVKGKPRWGADSMIIWIDKKTYLVVRIDDERKFADFRTETRTTFNPTIDQEIKDKLLEFDPPVPK